MSSDLISCDSPRQAEASAVIILILSGVFLAILSDYSIVNWKSRRIRGICTTPCSYEPYEHHAGAGFDQTIQACCVPNAKPSSDKSKPLDRDDVVRALPPEPNGVYGRVGPMWYHAWPFHAFPRLGACRRAYLSLHCLFR